MFWVILVGFLGFVAADSGVADGVKDGTINSPQGVIEQLNKGESKYLD